MIKNNLSRRLQMIADIVPNNVNLADIGADHGYLIRYLKENGLINKAYASDNKKGPFERLKSNLKDLDVQADLVDGIRKIPSYINAVCIAGMGGDTIISIIEESKSKLNQIEYFIISSHGLNNEVRKYLFDNDYSLINQDACFDDGDHYYEVNLFKKGKMQYDELDVEFGRILIEKCNLSFIENIKINVDKMHNLINKNNLPQDKIDEINKEINKYYSVLNLFNF